MATAIGDLAVYITADAAGFTKGVNDAIATAERFTTTAVASVAAGVAAFAGYGIKLAADAEQAQAAFEVMLGSVSAAKTMLGDIKTFAAATPFGTADLRGAAQMLLSYGVAGSEIMPILKQLGDVSGGDAGKLEGLARAFAQTSAMGRLMGQDLNQMVSNGFNPLEEIAKATGLSMGDLKKAMEDGKISIEMVKASLASATGEGGKFFGMMDKQSKTISGLWSTLKDDAANLALEVGEALLPAVTELVKLGSAAVKWFRELSSTTVQNTLRLTAFAAGFVAVVTIIPKIVTGIMSLVRMFRLLASSEAIAQALSGPAGWATLAAGAAIAGGAVLGLEYAFDQLHKKSQEIDPAATAKAMGTVSDVYGDLTKESEGDIKKLAQQREREQAKLATDGQRWADSLRTPAEIMADKYRDLNRLQIAGAIGAETFRRGVESITGEFEKATEASEHLNASQAKAVGAVTQGSSAAYSAVQEAFRNQQADRELEKKNLATAERSEKVLKEIRDTLGQDTRNNSQGCHVMTHEQLVIELEAAVQVYHRLVAQTHELSERVAKVARAGIRLTHLTEQLHAHTQDAERKIKALLKAAEHLIEESK